MLQLLESIGQKIWHYLSDDQLMSGVYVWIVLGIPMLVIIILYSVKLATYLLSLMQ